MAASKKSSFIYSAVRTPVGAFQGTLSPLSAPELGAAAVREALRRSRVRDDQIEEVILGNVISAGIGQAPARQAALKSGLPESIGATTVNKVCGSGLKAVILADQMIRLQEADFVVAGGMESMSQAPYLLPQMRGGKKLGNAQIVDSLIHDGLWDPHEDRHMGQLCERIARDRCYSREHQDAYALRSYTRALTAHETGAFDQEIVEVPVNHRGKTGVVRVDEQPFAEDLDQIPFMNPVFEKNSGTITKGNGAKINDGAAALVIGKESRNLTPLARIIGYAGHAQAPGEFGLAPAQAVEKALERCRLTVKDIDLFELNEAFAVVSLTLNDLLDLDPEKVNVNGGSIAL
ncbi:MAG: acetyl-CoA C-acyltransferase, partial [Nitrospinaceae bacterium]|nr:thiolase family protein [Nitrospinaceae bacterium]NIR54474.1 thiolase family protein [Nitrospinaceae bacterium]NIS84893.1 thiolase family protein [Nitrospinaceae bacterium]NIT81705.1 thiolase family protein [Nitrospinaceae bacterium]NIU43976.1 thiolase family protein [Nitrospinaceae bacterium]